MPNETTDPSMNTQAFQAWASQESAPVQPAGSKLPLIIGIAAAAVIVLGLLVWLVLS